MLREHLSRVELASPLFIASARQLLAGGDQMDDLIEEDQAVGRRSVAQAADGLRRQDRETQNLDERTQIDLFDNMVTRRSKNDPAIRDGIIVATDTPIVRNARMEVDGCLLHPC